MSIAVAILSIGVPGLVAWIWQLWLSHQRHQIHIAENYYKKSEIDAILKEIRRDTRFTRRVVTEIVKRLELSVPAVAEEDDA